MSTLINIAIVAAIIIAIVWIAGVILTSWMLWSQDGSRDKKSVIIKIMIALFWFWHAYQGLRESDERVVIDEDSAAPAELAAYHEGREAFGEGLELSDCPANHSHKDIWRHGWTDACAETK